MSTRCQIGFYKNEDKSLEDWEALIYCHSDGYPDSDCGVMADIVPILADFHKNRGLDDVEYAAAWLVAKLKADYLNIGICKALHGDIAYFYAVSPQGIRVFDVGFDVDFDDFKEMPEHNHHF